MIESLLLSNTLYCMPCGILTLLYLLDAAAITDEYAGWTLLEPKNKRFTFSVIEPKTPMLMNKNKRRRKD